MICQIILDIAASLRSHTIHKRIVLFICIGSHPQTQLLLLATSTLYHQYLWRYTVVFPNFKDIALVIHEIAIYDIIFKNHSFPYIFSIVVGNPWKSEVFFHSRKVWKTMIFKMSYLMNYKCNVFKIWKDCCSYTSTPTDDIMLRLPGVTDAYVHDNQ